MSLIDNQQPKIIIKWLFNYSQWPITEPELQPYIRLLNTINEREKITNLVYLSDKLASLTGRLMLYKLISMILLELEKKKRVEGDDKTLLELWKKIEIEYSKDGKPKVSEKLIKEYPSLINLRFNIAHHGDYSILIAGYRIHLGVDVMQIKLVQNEISEMNFISDFEGEFSKREWNEIIKHHSKSKHYTSLNRFMEYWCLKEALLKGIGIGLQLPLNEIDFNLNEKPAKQNLDKPWYNTSYALKQNTPFLLDFQFEERYISLDHCTAIAYKPIQPTLKIQNTDLNFELLLPHHLVSLNDLK